MKKTGNDLKKEKQSVIFEAALKVIREKGFHRARMADIAKEAGISYGLVYHYYKSKDDLCNDILNQWWVKLYQLLEKIKNSEDDFHLKLRGLILYFLNTYQRKPDLMNIFITQISRSTDNLTKTRMDFFKKFIALTEVILIQGQKKGVLRSDFETLYLTYIFLGALDTFLSVMVLGDQKIKSDGHKERIADTILEVFLNGAKAKKREG
jgi:TetR/AcrR family transcriptional regulator, fatty acid metabolism regulator protein